VKVKELRDALGSYHAKQADIQAFDELLEPLNELEVDELCAAIRVSVAKLSKAATAKKKKLQALNTEAVDRYAAELATTTDDNTAFEAVVKRIEKDRAIKVAEAKEIARRFTGEVLKSKSKGETLKAVRSVRLQTGV
jgi:hypothetical protein